MRLPLHIGFPILVALLLMAGAVDIGPERSALLVVAIVLALWMAFSLNIRPRGPPEPEEDPDAPVLEPPEDIEPLDEKELKALEDEARKAEHPRGPYRR
jgi:hypothetical protein